MIRWTSELDAQLKELLNSTPRLSFPKIAKAMGGGEFNKNVIAGRLKRLGLCAPKRAPMTAEEFVAYRTRRREQNKLRAEQRRREKGIEPRNFRGKRAAVVRPMIVTKQVFSISASGAAPKPEYEQPPERQAEVTPLHLTFDQLDWGDCRWPYGDGPFTFCGHAKLEGRSYCLHHFEFSRGDQKQPALSLQQHRRAHKANLRTQVLQAAE